MLNCLFIVERPEIGTFFFFWYKDIHLAFRISVPLLPFRHFYVPLYRLMLKIVRISADFYGAEIMSLIL